MQQVQQVQRVSADAGLVWDGDPDIGGVWGAGTVMRVMGLRRSELDRRRARLHLLAVWGDWRWWYPSRQFHQVDGAGSVLEGLAPVLEMLVPVIDAAPTARWLGSACADLGGTTPWDALSVGDDRAGVLAAAGRRAGR